MNSNVRQKLLPSQQQIPSKSALSKVWQYLCPCFAQTLIPIDHIQNNIREKQEEREDEQIVNEGKSQKEGSCHLTIEALILGLRQKQGSIRLFKSFGQVVQNFDEESNIYTSTIKRWHSYPISQFNHHEFVLLGKQKFKMLAKVFTVKLSPSLLAQQLKNKSRFSCSRQSQYFQSNVDKYWNKRYNLFQKFDQGILINQSSWPTMIPEVVSDHIASKIKCNVVLNVFCGVGGESIKLASSCGKVIATDLCGERLRCLQNNAKIYGVENLEIKSNMYDNNFECEPSVILISSYCKLDNELFEKPSFSPMEMKPDLKLIIHSALKICKSIVLVLPANINVQQLGVIFAEEIMSQGILTETCCLQIENIFYKSELKYIAVYFGNLMESKITLNDELQWLYGLLDVGSKKLLPYKKWIKKFRETLGMVKLLNALLDSKNHLKNEFVLDNLCTYLQDNQLIPEDKLLKIMFDKQNLSQKHSSKKSNDETEKSEGTDSEEEQKTISDLSIPSHIQRIESDQRDVESEKQQTSPYKSALMLRQTSKQVQSSISIAAPANSSPYRSAVHKFRKSIKISEDQENEKQWFPEADRQTKQY